MRATTLAAGLFMVGLLVACQSQRVGTTQPTTANGATTQSKPTGSAAGAGSVTFIRWPSPMSTPACDALTQASVAEALGNLGTISHLPNGTGTDCIYLDGVDSVELNVLGSTYYPHPGAVFSNESVTSPSQDFLDATQTNLTAALSNAGLGFGNVTNVVKTPLPVVADQAISAHVSFDSGAVQVILWAVADNSFITLSLLEKSAATNPDAQLAAIERAIK